MDDLLISEQEYSEYLKKRDKPLTSDQIRQLREIEKAALFLDYFDVLEEDVVERTAKVMRNRQREILSSEKKPTSEKIASLVPEQVKVVLRENSII